MQFDDCKIFQNVLTKSDKYTKLKFANITLTLYCYNCISIDQTYSRQDGDITDAI